MISEPLDLFFDVEFTLLLGCTTNSGPPCMHEAELKYIKDVEICEFEIILQNVRFTR